MSDIIVETVLKLSRRTGIKKAVLSGGVFQNKYLRLRSSKRLAAKGIKVYEHSIVSTNDSGIPIGQLAIANARVRCA